MHDHTTHILPAPIRTASLLVQLAGAQLSSECDKCWTRTSVSKTACVTRRGTIIRPVAT